MAAGYAAEHGYDFAGECAAIESECAADEMREARDMARDMVPDMAPELAGVTDEAPDAGDDVLEELGLMTERNKPKDGRGRWWAFVAYADQLGEDWAKRLEARYDVRALAIWHDRDKLADGRPAKPHLHIMAGDSRGRKWSKRQAKTFARQCLGYRDGGEDDARMQGVKSPGAFALYLTHRTAPEKAQYPESAVMAFGGADYAEVAGVVDNRARAVGEMKAWVREFEADYGCVPAVAGLEDFADACRPSWARALRVRGVARSMGTYIRSREYDSGVDGRGRRTLDIVDAMIDAELSASVDAEAAARAERGEKDGDEVS